MATPSTEDTQLEDRGNLTLKVHWSPPLVVLYDLTSEERKELDEELGGLVREALAEDPLVKEVRKEEAEIGIERGLIGPTAQAVTTVDVEFRNVPQELLTEIADAVDNHRRNLVSRARSGLMSLTSVVKEVAGIRISPVVSFEWESESPIRPTLQQETSEELLYLSIRIPPGVTPSNSDWNRIVEVAPDVGDWFLEGFKEYLTEKGVQPQTVEVMDAEVVQQPPFAGPLVPEFYFVIGSVIGVIGERVINGAIDAGLEYAKKKLNTRIPPDEVLSLSCSPEELVRRAQSYVRRNGYDHANLEASYVGFNRRSQSGYIFPIDPEKPMGWDISVRFYEGEWKFRVLNDPRQTQLTILSTDSEVINTKTVDLFEFQELHS